MSDDATRLKEAYDMLAEGAELLRHENRQRIDREMAQRRLAWRRQVAQLFDPARFEKRLAEAETNQAAMPGYGEFA